MARNKTARAWFIVWFLVVACLTVCRAPAAWASDASAAEDLIRQAIKLRREGKDHDAFPLLQRAYELSRTARTAAQLGLVEMALGYWVDAEGHVSEALAAADNPWIASNRTVLNGVLRTARDKNAELRFFGKPTGASVSINGKLIGRLPIEQAVLVSRGRIDIDVTADGFLPRSFSTTVTVRTPPALNIELQVKPAAPVPPTEPAAAVVVNRNSAPAEDPGRTLRLTGIGCVAAGAGALLGSVVAGVAAHRDGERLSQLDATWTQSNANQISDGTHLANVERVLLVGGAILVAGGAVLYIRGRPDSDHAVAVTPAIGRSLAGLSMAGAF